MTSTKVVMASLKWFTSSDVQDKGRRLQVHRECLQDRLDTIQSITQHLPALLLRLDVLPADLEYLPLASQRHDSCRLWNCGIQMSQGLRTCLHCRILIMMNRIQMMRPTIGLTWAVQRSNPQLAWRKLNSPWSNLPKGWGRPTTVHSTRGRMCGWLGCPRKGIGP